MRSRGEEDKSTAPDHDFVMAAKTDVLAADARRSGASSA
jgi:hypothetical protein